MRRALATYVAAILINAFQPGVCVLRSSSQVRDSSSALTDVDSALQVERSAFQRYLHSCQDSLEARRALARIDRGDASSYHSERAEFRYMRSTWCALKFVGGDAKSILDVGSSFPPFLRSVDWVPEMSLVSPYFPGEGSSNPCGERDHCKTWPDISVNVADFYRWGGRHQYDVVMCSQVLEHVDNPSSFLRKLLRTGKQIVVSVPYLWKDYHLHFHKSHHVSIRDVRRWAGKHERVYSVVSEPHGGGFARRVILVFDGDDV